MLKKIKNSIKSVLIKLKLYKIITVSYDEIVFIRDFIKILYRIILIKKERYLFFFFPHYCTGGAQKVHLDIVKVFKELKPVVFITSNSTNDQYLTEFKENALFFDLLPYIKRKKSKQLLSKVIIYKINSLKKATVFGCDSYYFYQLLPLFNIKRIKRIDLLHTFTFPDEPGAEKWSLPMVSYLDKRIVISQHLKNLLINQYRTNHISIYETEKIEVIYNKTEKPVESINKDFTGKIKIIYIGRYGPEKRVPLVLKIIEKLRFKTNIEFYIAGFEKGEMDQVYFEKGNCMFLGVINDSGKLNGLLSSMHILLLVSSREGLPLVINEAMTYGVVPLCTNVGAISEIIMDGQNGYLFDSEQNENDLVEAFSAKIFELNENRNRLKQHSDQCFIVSNERYLQSNFDVKYYEILN